MARNGGARSRNMDAAWVQGSRAYQECFFVFFAFRGCMRKWKTFSHPDAKNNTNWISPVGIKRELVGLKKSQWGTGRPLRFN